MRQFLRNLLYPGLDLHTRNRASLTQFWMKGKRRVLDAGVELATSPGWRIVQREARSH